LAVLAVIQSRRSLQPKHVTEKSALPQSHQSSKWLTASIRCGAPGRNSLPCRFHDDKHPSFSVNEEKGLFYCFPNFDLWEVIL